jgi:hypothetical protein
MDFGRQVLERLAPAALEGTATLSFEPAGLVWTIEVGRSGLVGLVDRFDGVGTDSLQGGYP